MTLLSALRRSNRYERLAILAAMVGIGALALPWYRAPFERSLAETGLETFGFASAALLLTTAAALFLITRSASGRRPPLPMHEGTLLAIAGLWSTVIVVSLMLDRPRLQVGAFETDYNLAFGIFVELGAAAALAFAGWRLRHRELTPAGPGARNPSASSPPRFPRSPS
jgi:hypothetical protein